MQFADTLRSVRREAGLTQAALATRSGVSRPNIVAYEAGRREPLFASAVSVLESTGASITIEPPVTWRWTDDLRPVAVASRLWRLPIAQALAIVEPGINLWWSGPPRTFDLSQRSQRLRLYEIVLREGRPQDLEAIIDGLLLSEAWPELVVPRRVRSAWDPLIAGSVESFGRRGS